MVNDDTSYLLLILGQAQLLLLDGGFKVCGERVCPLEVVLVCFLAIIDRGDEVVEV